MGESEEIERLIEVLFPDGEEERTLTKDEFRNLLAEHFENSEHDDALYLENLLNYIPEKIYFKDRDSNFLKVNRYFAESFGYEDPEKLEGKSDFDLFPYKVAIQKFADEQKVIQKDQIISGKDELDSESDAEEVRWVSTTKLPLLGKDKEIVGTFGISRDITDRKISEEKLKHFAEELSLKNDQIESDLEMARNVQMAFIPKNYPSFVWDLSSNESALKFFHRYVPSEKLAGDFFQVIPISNSQAGVIVCDVMGHGVRASLVTAILRGLVGEMKLITPYPQVFLRKVNQSLNSVFRQLDAVMFVTAFYAVFDLLKGQLRYANAGHPMPVLLNRSQGKAQYLEAVTESPEPALGLVDNFKYSSKSIDIGSGDSVFFYTDGILEMENPKGEQFGGERLLNAVDHSEHRTSETILDNLFNEVNSHCPSLGGQDDMCAVSVDVMRVAAQS